MAIAGFTQKFGVQAYEYALFNNLNAVFNEEQILKVTHSIAGYKTFEEWRTGGNYMVRYIKKMKTQANIDDLENASSVREWCLDGLELTCKCNLYADFGDGCESGGKCAEYAFKNLITTEIRDISEKYMKYLFDSIKEALPPLNLPVTFCKLKANFLFSNSRMKNNTYITAIINEDIKAEGFSETNIEQNKEFAFFHKREKSLALPSFVWSYIFEGFFDFDFQSVKADKPEEWCDRVLPKLAPKPNGQKLEELEESESNESDYELEVLTLGKPVEHPSY
ncbi:Hypothetical protein CINCED_3A010958 [Cinara cedri]|uniref:Uncharacterized protein n=1 Tax=Cinara cedri TaxID=506608 RepID=A0A5E4NJB4_9HEMI|nr:Hypothetical protein CINCED_3A010958 [Cinara cedri]